MESFEPYAAPQASIDPLPLDPGTPIEAASKIRRFVNWLVDTVVMVAVMFVLVVVISILGGESSEFVVWLDGMNWWQEQLLGSALSLVYYAAMEGMLGFSIGKLITDTRVVDARGQPIGFRTATLRSLCRLIPFNALSLLLSDDAVRRGWHDRLTDTYVIRHRRAAVIA